MGSNLRIRLTGALVIAGLLSGCSSTPTYQPRERKHFVYAVRQIAPDPTYNRMSYVRPPESMPKRKHPHHLANSPLILPVFHLDIKEGTLEEAARVLAATTRYRAYCSSIVAYRKISINTLGTVDELAQQIERAAGIRVFVDHANQEVRFTANTIVEPKLLEEKVEG